MSVLADGTVFHEDNERSNHIAISHNLQIFFLGGGRKNAELIKKSKKYGIQGNCVGSGKGGSTGNGVQELNRHFKMLRHLAHFVVSYNYYYVLTMLC